MNNFEKVVLCLFFILVFSLITLCILNALPRDPFKWAVYRNFIGGLNDTKNSYEIGDNEFRDVENFDFFNLSISGRKGYDVIFKKVVSDTPNPIISITKYYKSNGEEFLIETSEDTYYKIDVPNDTFIILSTGNAKVPVDFETINDQLYIINGTDENKVFNGDSIFIVGIDEPSKVADTFSVTTGLGGGKIDSGTYKYLITFYNSITGYEGNPMPILNLEDEFIVKSNGGNANITLTGIPINTSDSKVNARRIYRTKANGSLYFRTSTILNNTDTIFVDNTNDFALIDLISFRNGKPKKAIFIETINGITYYVDAINRSKIYFSELNLPESVDPTNSFNVNQDDGDIITGIKAQDDLLFITKRNSIHIWFNPSPDPFNKGILRQVSKEVGCSNNKAMTSLANGIIFAEEDGVYQFRNNFVAEGIGNANISKISFKIEETIKSLDFTNASMVFHDNQIYISCSKDASLFNNVILVYNTKYQYWTKYTGIDASELLVLNGGSDDNQLIFGSGLSNYLGTMNITNSDGKFKDVTDTFTFLNSDSIYIINLNDTEMIENSFIGTKIFIIFDTETIEKNVIIKNDTSRLFLLNDIVGNVDTTTILKIGTIDKKLKSKFFVLDNPILQKRARKLWMDYEADVEDFTIDYFFDNDQSGGLFTSNINISSSSWDLGTWASDTLPNSPTTLIWDFGSVQRSKSDFPKFSLFNRISYGLEDNSVNDINIRNIMIQYKTERER